MNSEPAPSGSTDGSPSAVQAPADRESTSEVSAPIQMLQRIDPRTKPNLKRAIPTGLIALISFAVGSNLGGLGTGTSATLDLFGWRLGIAQQWVAPLIIGVTLIFVIFGVIAGRAIGKELFRVSSTRAGIAAGAAIRLIAIVICYVLIAFGALALLQVNVGSLLVGGAVTGVVLGIAAQQTLSNFFAGLVLFFARPYVPGQRVRIHSGALGGPFEGVIIDAGMMYTLIKTDEGPISLPNSGLLAAAVGPISEPPPEELQQPEPLGTVADRSTQAQ